MNDGRLPVQTLSLDQAVELAREAKSIALGGWSFSRRPIGIVRKLIEKRQAIHELLVLTGGIETDLLLAAGLVTQVRAFYLGMEILGLGPGLKSAARVVEETESSLVLGLRAAVGHQPFVALPLHLAEALLPLRPELKTGACPYTGQAVVLAPAIRPDLCYLHAAVADTRGWVSWGGHHGADALLSQAARCTVVTCDELVPELDPATHPVHLNPLQVDAVVHCPGGAWPTSCLPAYGIDWEAMIEYVGLERQAAPAWIADRRPRTS